MRVISLGRPARQIFFCFFSSEFEKKEPPTLGDLRVLSDFWMRNEDVRRERENVAGVRLADDTTTLSSCLIIIHRVHLSAREGTAGHGNPNEKKMSPAGTLTSQRSGSWNFARLPDVFAAARKRKKKISSLPNTLFRVPWNVRQSSRLAASEATVRPLVFLRMCRKLLPDFFKKKQNGGSSRWTGADNKKMGKVVFAFEPFSTFSSRGFNWIMNDVNVFSISKTLCVCAKGRASSRAWPLRYRQLWTRPSTAFCLRLSVLSSSVSLYLPRRSPPCHFYSAHRRSRMDGHFWATAEVVAGSSAIITIFRDTTSNILVVVDDEPVLLPGRPIQQKRKKTVRNRVPTSCRNVSFLAAVARSISFLYDVILLFFFFLFHRHSHCSSNSHCFP